MTLGPLADTMTNYKPSDDHLHALERRQILFDRATRMARMGAWECDLASERITWTEGVYDLFELPVGTSVKRASIADLYIDGSREQMEAMRADVIRNGGPRYLDARVRTCRGALRWVRLSIDVEREHGQPIRIFGSKQDVTAERDAIAQLQAMAERDCLTGLANRRTFDARFCDVVADGSSDALVSALVLIDLDQFKAINDAFGHLAGDECLRRVAMRLQRAFRQATLIARIGGDEFAVLLSAGLRAEAIQQTLLRACIALNRPLFWNGRSISAGASIGATILGRPHIRKRAELFAEADAALYAAKAAGRNTVRVFGDDPCIQAAGTLASRVA